MKLQPYLNFDGNCAEAFRFYEQVLGGKAAIQSFRDSPMAGGTAAEHLDRTLHASLEVGDQVILGSDSWPGQHATPQGFAVSISVNDEGEAERLFSQLSENGTVQMPLQETFWAARFGMLVDRYGTPWMVNCETAA